MLASGPFFCYDIHKKTPPPLLEAPLLSGEARDLQTGLAPLIGFLLLPAADTKQQKSLAQSA